ncbi:MAG: RsmE family RNA methyltransferase [Opitutae bacterium]
MNRIIRAFSEKSPTSVGEEFDLSETESIHLSRVLRIQAGESLEVLDGRGGCFRSECVAVNRAKVRVRVLEVKHASQLVPQVQMVIALGKGNKWEDLIRPLTELGVDRLTPLLTERTEGRFDQTKLENKKDRWHKIAQEACKQSGNPWMPLFDDPITFDDALSPSQPNVDCWMGSLRQDLIKFSPKSNQNKLSIFVGPEGGWTLEEEAKARDSGFSFFTLCHHVLRVETAAVSALAVARQH